MKKWVHHATKRGQVANPKNLPCLRTGLPYWKVRIIYAELSQLSARDILPHIVHTFGKGTVTKEAGTIQKKCNQKCLDTIAKIK